MTVLATGISVTNGTSCTGTGTVYFLRHGESTSNEKNIFAGIIDVPLTDFGRQQARQAGQDIKKRGLQFDVVYVSHLQRAKETCAIALQESNALKNAQTSTNEDRRLGERSFGIFAGCNLNLLGQTLGYHGFETLLHAHNEAPPRGEKVESIYFRIAAFYEEVIVPHLNRGENILVVCHQYVLEPLALFLANKPPSSYKRLNLPNGKALSQQELIEFHNKESSAVASTRKYINDLSILWAVLLGAFGFLTGTVIQGVSNHAVTLPASGFLFTIIVLLALSSFYSYLDIDLSSARKKLNSTVTKASMGLTLFKWVACVLIGLLFGDNLIGLAPWLVLILVPPALTSPNYSLLWGGNLDSTALVSIMQSILIPVLLPVLLLFMGLHLPFDAFSGFYLVLIFGLTLPVIVAQVWRFKSPVKSKRHAKEWKFIGILATVLMGLFAGLYFTPPTLLATLFYTADPVSSAISLQKLTIALLIFLGLRLVVVAFTRLLHPFKEAADNTDYYILAVNPNIFLWSSLVSATAFQPNAFGNPYVLFWSLLLFFCLPVVDQIFITNLFTKTLLRRAMASSRTLLDLEIEDIQTGLGAMEQSSFLAFLDELVQDLEYLVSANNNLIDYRQLKRKLSFILDLVSFKVSQLLQAERVTIFLVDHQNHVLKTINAIGPGGKKISFEISMNSGIAGHVARTGETVNICDPYKDPNFNRQVDLDTGFKTRNLLCLPMFNSQKETIAVIQALNKVNGADFLELDVQKLIPSSKRLSAILEKMLECDRLIGRNEKVNEQFAEPVLV